MGCGASNTAQPATPTSPVESRAVPVDAAKMAKEDAAIEAEMKSMGMSDKSVELVKVSCRSVRKLP